MIRISRSGTVRRPRRFILAFLPLLLLLSLRLVSAAPSSLAPTAASIAQSYHHHTERRYNRSTLIDRWNRAAGVPVGSSWCQSFVWSMFDSAARKLRVPNPMLRTASVSRSLAYAATNSRLQVIPIRGVIGATKMYTPERGDVAAWKRRGGARRDIGRLWLGHTGFILRADGPGFLLTIEGNTGASFADGDGVYRKRRRTRTILAIIRAL